MRHRGRRGPRSVGSSAVLRRLAPLAVLLAAASLAAAHGPLPARGGYDPLLHHAAWGLTAGGGLALDERSADALAPLPAPRALGEAGDWVAFRGALPFALLPIEPFRVTLAIALESPALVADPATGGALLLDLRIDGRPLDDGPRVVRADAPVGARAFTVDERIAAGGLPLARNATVELRVASLAPAPTALALDLARSTLHLESASATSVDELGLATAGFPAFALEGFAIRPTHGGGYVATGVVEHESVRFPNATFPVNETVYLVLRGEEPARVAYERHHFVRAEDRRAAAHVVDVGSARVELAPGLVVVAPLRLAEPGAIRVACVERCAGEAGEIRFAREAAPGLYFGESGYAIVDANGSVRDSYEGPVEEAPAAPTPASETAPILESKSAPRTREVPTIGEHWTVLALAILATSAASFDNPRRR